MGRPILGAFGTCFVKYRTTTSTKNIRIELSVCSHLSEYPVLKVLILTRCLQSFHSNVPVHVGARVVLRGIVELWLC